jgi:NAD(P)-dependent dehydrogenase (short-subunit alcohol dehydrogenase family)
MTKLNDKVVVITGAGSGIGRALAVEATKRGAHVALADVNETSLRETARLLDWKTKVTTHCVDVRDRARVERFAAEVEAEHGGADVIINNAGVAVRATIEEVSYEDFALVIDVNLWGVVYGTKAFLPLLRKRPEGHIVNISSINGMVPFAKNAPYNMSKYAVLGFSETLMQELSGQPIHVTCVHPGGIKTNIARNGRGASAAEIAFFDRIAMTTPGRTAKVVLDAVEHNRERVLVGPDAKLMAAAKRLVPSWTVRLIGAASLDPVKKWARSAG